MLRLLVVFASRQDHTFSQCIQYRGHYRMPRPPVIKAHEIRHALKVAAVTGQNALRDVALLTVFYGTGLTANEVARLQVSDYLSKSGKIRVDSAVRPEIAFNGKTRPLVSANTRTCAAIDA
ncbi:hypothetical protein ACFPTO_12910 [Paraburkholderia denitrificans]|uniref:Tyr recombinase domain-containing protein n=1 Tax=Paraburkholderia denitrificans TaxID=694025 RepID=A0ABW0J9H9_9BURK